MNIVISGLSSTSSWGNGHATTYRLHRPDGRQTAPDHWLGDLQRSTWRQCEMRLPADAAWSAPGADRAAP
jgi:hypothetical protein